uniref:RNA pseudouridylate synthase domain-containing protein 1 n=1 Tax=Geotrypetes seraphini TaxID=260995 RepID=A0A6P8NN32_GEOSA|nr:RNA pseudouridylate synthase domain-containing protein 1 [Geotrypetes seraphini]
MEPGSLENLSILYQSRDFIVVNKHWDIRIDSKMWYEQLTVQSQLKHKFPELADPGTYHGFRFCHQLDFSTSGALCVALNKAAAGRVYKCFIQQLVTKAYLALVRGSVRKDRLTINYAIGKDTREGLTHMMCAEGTEGCDNAKPCQTELIVLQHGLYSGEPVTKVLLQPLTGRTHQLRVHCAAIGHPIVGDFTYSFKKDTEPYRMMLHAYALRIPMDTELIDVIAPDTFVSMVDKHWSPQHTICEVDLAVHELKARETGAGMEKTEFPLRKEMEGTGKEEARPESEEQRALCEQWLAEMTLA